MAIKKKSLPAVQPQVLDVVEKTLPPQELQPLAQPSSKLLAKLNAVKDNFESIDNLKLPRIKMTADGFEITEGHEPVKELSGTIISTRRTNVYYAKPYNQHEVTPPDCYSLDGKFPDASIQKPVNETCRGCPMAEFGTNAMKSGKACRNLKPIYLILDEEIMPRQVTVTPASLRAADAYLTDLGMKGFSYRTVETKITASKKNVRNTYLNLEFIKTRTLDAQEIADVEYLKSFWQTAMNSQVIDQREVDNASATQVSTPSGEY